MNSYQTAWTINTDLTHALSGSTFVKASTPKAARALTLQYLRNTYKGVEVLQWFKTIAREPSDRFPGTYINQ